MTRRRVLQRVNETSRRIDRATFQPGDYGQVMRADGTAQWWVRSSHGAWTARPHQRVIENDDGTITLLYVT